MPEEDDQPAIRHQYAEHGVRRFYEAQGENYRNPHEDAIADVLRRSVADWTLRLDSVLDLACGSGEVTLALQPLGAGQITGVDPYTYATYERRTGRKARRHTFEDIAGGVLSDETFDLIVCSYALHLVEESRLPVLLLALAATSTRLLILSPHKRPEIRPDWGWRLAQESYRHRIRTRLFETLTD